MARIVRGQALALREREFIEAAVVGGAGTAAHRRRHIVPNLLGPVIVYATLTVPQVILVESFLSFLGIGIQEPLASLGNLIADGAAELETAPWMLAVPAGCLVLLVFCVQFLRRRTCATHSIRGTADGPARHTRLDRRVHGRARGAAP